MPIQVHMRKLFPAAIAQRHADIDCTGLIAAQAPRAREEKAHQLIIHAFAPALHISAKPAPYSACGCGCY